MGVGLEGQRSSYSQFSPILAQHHDASSLGHKFGVSLLPSSEAKLVADLYSTHNKQTNDAATDIIYKINNNGVRLEEFPIKSRQWKVPEYGKGVYELYSVLAENESMNSGVTNGRSRQKLTIRTRDWSPSAIKSRRSKVIPFHFVLVETENENSEYASSRSDDIWGLSEISPTEASIEFLDDVSILTQDDAFDYEEENQRPNVLLAVQDAALTDYLSSRV